MGSGFLADDPMFSPCTEAQLSDRSINECATQSNGLNFLLLFDLPELPELGSVDSSEGPLRNAQDLAAAAFRARRTWFLTNGSTGGLHAALLAAVQVFHHRRQLESPSTRDAAVGPARSLGAIVAVPRNAHRSVISALTLSGAQPHFLEVEYSPHGLPLGVNVEDQIVPLLFPGKSSRKQQQQEKECKENEEERWRHGRVAAVVLVSPTYHGVVTDVAGAARVCRAAGVVLIVDEAHGAHLPFLHPHLLRHTVPAFTSALTGAATATALAEAATATAAAEAAVGGAQEQRRQLEQQKQRYRAALQGALANGADVVMQSSHKTLTALTQASMMHLGHGASSSSAHVVAEEEVTSTRAQVDRAADNYDDNDNDAVEGKACNEPLPRCDPHPPPPSCDGRPSCDRELLEEALSDAVGLLSSSSQSALLLASLDNTRRQFAAPDPRLVDKAPTNTTTSTTSTTSSTSSSCGARRLRRAARVAAVVRRRVSKELGLEVLGFSPESPPLSSPPPPPSRFSSVVALDPLRLTVFIPPFSARAGSSGGDNDSDDEGEGGGEGGSGGGGGGYAADEILMTDFGVYCELPEELFGGATNILELSGAAATAAVATRGEESGSSRALEKKKKGPSFPSLAAPHPPVLNGGALTFAFSAGTTAAHARRLLKGLEAVASQTRTKKRASPPPPTQAAAATEAPLPPWVIKREEEEEEDDDEEREGKGRRVTARGVDHQCIQDDDESYRDSEGVDSRHGKDDPENGQGTRMLSGGGAVASTTPREAFFAPRVTVEARNAVGRRSVDTVCVYPPGVALLVPGQEVKAEVVAYLEAAKRLGATITGVAEHDGSDGENSNFESEPLLGDTDQNRDESTPRVKSAVETDKGRAQIFLRVAA